MPSLRSKISSVHQFYLPYFCTSFDKNTIHPNEGIVGYMNIKRKKGHILTINIPISGYVYSFELDVNKKNNK